MQVTDTYSTNCPSNGETCSSFTVESDKFYGPVVTSDSTAAPAAFQGLDWTVSNPPPSPERERVCVREFVYVSERETDQGLDWTVRALLKAFTLHLS